MSEFEDAKRLADKVLDTPFRDPDDDLSMMSRQFNRAIERAEAAEQSLLKWRIAFQSVTPGGSEFQTPDEVLAWARRLKDEIHRAKIDRELSRRAAEAAEREVARLRAAYEELKFCEENNAARCEHIDAPEDAMISELCERIGYGAVMDAAARLWRRKDPKGAFTVGPPVVTVQRLLALSPASPEEGDQDDAAQANPSQPAWEVYDQTLTIEEMEALGYAPRREPDEEGDHAE